jgi:hypothetical protein
LWALLDSGSQDNYISGPAMARAGLRPKNKEQPYTVTVANGAQGGIIRQEVHEWIHITPQWKSMVRLSVFGLAAHDIILGLPWLRDQNPRINWKDQTISMEYNECNSIRRDASSAEADERIVTKTDTSPMTAQEEMSRNKLKRPPARKVEKQRIVEHQRSAGIPKRYWKYAEMFVEKVGLGALPKHKPWDHKIDLIEGKHPGFMPIYKLTEKELQVLKKYIEENMAKGFIRKSTSSAGYPVLFAPKKDGSLRLCIDYRKLNDITKKNRYPLPNIQELRDRLSGAKVFTALDLRGAYNLIRMKEGEEWKTAFRTRYGHYEYTVMPFGLTNAPASCQELINDALREYLDVFVIAYLDDILVYSSNMTEHYEHVERVLEKLKEYDLELKPEKCEFHKEEVEFLGHMVGINGVRIGESKIKTIREWETPKTVKDIQSFLGFVNFNRQFIKDFSKIAIQLTKLTKKEIAWEWGEPQERAFQALKEACIQEPVLIAFTSGKPLRIETDASDLALGAVLLQEKEGKWHPIAYHSRKFSEHEERYDVHDKELLAIVVALEHWRHYAEGCSELTIFSDHKNLTYFTTTKQLNRRQVRWSETLGQYKFRIVYTPGKDNGRADALSRRHDIIGKKTEVHMAILQTNEDGSYGPSHECNNIMRIRPELPKEFEELVIRQHHDDASHGHQGTARTVELIQRNYHFPNMRQKVERYIRKCIQCQKNKHATHAKYGEAQAMELPTAPWEDIAMDFITDLPESADEVTGYKYNGILNVVCRFTKGAEFIPFRKDFTAKQLAEIFKDRIYRYHGIPKTIISDRDKLFTSNFWQTFLAEAGVRRKLSTAYHPETDGQTERTNRTLKQYLRTYCNYKQNNWVSLLPMAQITYNNKVAESTGETPYYALHGKHPNLFERNFPSVKAEAATRTLEEMKEVHRKMQEIMKKKQLQQNENINKHRKTAPQLKRGDKVYLLTKNLRTKRPNKGLDHVKVGPFLVKKQNGPVTYTLDLPKDAKIHPRFHVKLLEPADSDTPLQETFHYVQEEENEFEVEKILKRRSDQGRHQEFLVKWKGYPTSENTWEPEENLINCQQKLEDYWKEEKEPTTAKDQPSRRTATRRNR